MEGLAESCQFSLVFLNFRSLLAGGMPQLSRETPIDRQEVMKVGLFLRL